MICTRAWWNPQPPTEHSHPRLAWPRRRPCTCCPAQGADPYLAELYRRIEGALAFDRDITVHNAIGGPQLAGGGGYCAPRYARQPPRQATVLSALAAGKERLLAPPAGGGGAHQGVLRVDVLVPSHRVDPATLEEIEHAVT